MSQHEPEQQPTEQQSLLAELDARQNQLLDDLDVLNERIESLLRQWTVTRQPEAVEAGESAEDSAAPEVTAEAA